MRSIVVVACVLAVLPGCAAREAGGGSPGAPAAAPLSATFRGRPFQPRGILATRDGNGIDVLVYERPAACGTASASSLPGERYFDIVLKSWPMAANGTPIDAHAAGIGVNAMKHEGGGGSSSSLDGTLQLVSSTPTSGTIIIHARNGDGTLDGELPFAICN